MVFIKNKRSLAGLLTHSAPIATLLAIFLGILAGLLHSLIVPYLLYSISPSGDMPLFGFLIGQSADVSSVQSVAVVFFLGCFLILLTKAGSVLIANYITKGATTQLRIGLFNQVRRLPVVDIEKIGFSKIINILTRDIQTVASVTYSLPVVWVSGVTVLGLLGYLAFLNVSILLLVVASVILGLTLYHVPMRFAIRYLEQARSLQDGIQDGIKGLVLGAYELKLNTKKADEFTLAELIEPEKEALRLSRIGEGIFAFGVTFSDLIAYLIIGFVVFGLRYFFNINTSDLIAIVMVLIFVTGPITTMLQILPQVKQGNIALQRISELEALIDGFSQAGEIIDAKQINDWQRLTVNKISYRYKQELGEEFVLSPISLSFERGTITYIVGANGSGKSTFGRILSTHYTPHSGEMFIDDCLIDSSNISLLRSKIAVVFSNYFLFKKLYGFNNQYDEAKAKQYLEYLGLSEKTKIINGQFETTALSDGQRRRLALLTVLLEDREIYIFDEWAADQDPKFKEMFYKKILPELKAMGKLVIVITHDDRYFDCADRIIKMENGAVVEELSVLKKI